MAQLYGFWFVMLTLGCGGSTNTPQEDPAGGFDAGDASTIFLTGCPADLIIVDTHDPVIPTGTCDGGPPCAVGTAFMCPDGVLEAERDWVCSCNAGTLECTFRGNGHSTCPVSSTDAGGE